MTVDQRGSRRRSRAGRGARAVAALGLLSLAGCVGLPFDPAGRDQRVVIGAGQQLHGFRYAPVGGRTHRVSYSAPDGPRQVRFTLPDSAEKPSALMVGGPNDTEFFQIRLTDDDLWVQVSVIRPEDIPDEALRAVVGNARYLDRADYQRLAAAENAARGGEAFETELIKQTPGRRLVQAGGVFHTTSVAFGERALITHNARTLRDGLFIHASVRRDPKADQIAVAQILSDIVRSVEPDAPEADR